MMPQSSRCLHAGSSAGQRLGIVPLEEGKEAFPDFPALHHPSEVRPSEPGTSIIDSTGAPLLWLEEHTSGPGETRHCYRGGPTSCTWVISRWRLMIRWMSPDSAH
jgi:hypothetical protein